MTISLGELARRIGAVLEGDETLQIASCARIEDAQAGQVTFLTNSRYRSHLAQTQASAVIVSADTQTPDHLNRLVADDPYFAFRNAVIELHGPREHPALPVLLDSTNGNEVSDLACVHPDAKIGTNTRIFPFAVVEKGAQIGERSILYPNTYVGEKAKIGDDCILFPGSVVYDGCILADRCTIHANTVIGSDGFGYATHNGAHHKIPQVGIARLENDVELGSACVIERAAMGETKIGEGTKFADLVNIGHGTSIGKHNLFVSLVGVAGSVEVGDYVVLGGQVGVTGHIRIGNFVQAAAKTGIAQDVPDGSKIIGAPAVPIKQGLKNALIATDLVSLVKRIKKLEARIAELEEKSDAPKDQASE